ncbi:MAG: gliding motility-associated C-terminal domain-containing protein [Saprospirales bacterium]|nr:gliding motility-associated C-terminal domain-containing protein [Saprospirales bacterium]
MNTRIFTIFFVATLGFGVFPSLLTAQPCECTNCPVPIEDNGTFQGFLDVTVNGPNNLALCPLQQVCFEITHTWVGDLCVTLTSPGGLNYMVMADANNNSGGCGNSSDNINVCIDVGTGNPLTNNTEYICNGPPNLCLVGNWTMPCGGVTDPITNAQQAPGCNLNAFNQPGAPANGTWTLTVNDICSQDVGFLQNWSLSFACGVSDCFSCNADGGTINQPNITGCIGSPSLALNVVPQYAPAPPPPPADYGYVWVVSSNGTIVNFLAAPGGPNLNALPPGHYQICGLSYFLDEGTPYLAYLGQPYANLVNALSGSTPAFCGDLSNCFQATLGPAIPPTVIPLSICYGDCFTTPLGTQCCNSGVCSYTLPSWLGCDSVINVIITLIPPDITTIFQTLCIDDCLTIGGQEYCPPGGYTIGYVGSDGCDSTLVLTLTAVPVLSVIGPPPVITCTNPAVLLNGLGSVGNTFQWTNANGVVLANTPTLLVNQTGCYNLTVWNTINGVTCSDVSTVCVTSNLVLPGAPVVQGLSSLCINQSATYVISPVPNATTYDWTLPPGATLISGGDGTLSVTVNWTGPAGGNICVLAVNGCGPGPVTCFPVTLQNLPAATSISGPMTICANVISTYLADNLPNTTGYTWTIPAGATLISGQGTDSIVVNWGNAFGGNVCVTPNNNCGSGPQTCFPVVVGQLPATPVVSGPSPVCVGDFVDYTTNPDPEADSFNWIVPSCATIISGQGTNLISVQWDNSCSEGTICVEAVNGCGTSSQECMDVIVEDVPGLSAVNGALDPCENSTESYFTSPVPGAINYIWTVTGGTILTGQGTAGISVNWSTPGAGDVCMAVENECGSGEEFCLPVTVGALPEMPLITGPDVVCDSSVTQYSTPSDPAATGYLWTTSCGAIIAGQHGTTITIDWSGCPDGGTVCVTTETDCGDSPTVCFVVVGGELPGTPVLSGPDTLCLADIGTFCAAPDTNASTYAWTITGGVVVAGQGLECVDVEWTTLGTGMVCVIAENGCGISEETCFPVLIDGPPNAPTLDGVTQPCVNDVSAYTILTADPDVTGFNWTATNGGIIQSGQGTNSVEIEWPQAGLAQVCVAAANDCSFGQPQCFDLEVIAYPIPNAGADIVICGLEATLEAVLTTGTGVWTSSGPGTVTFSDPTDPAATVTASTYGDYTFTWTETLVNCSSADDMIVSFNADPQLSGAILTDCAGDGESYTVAFTIQGGMPPYSVNGNVGGILNGGAFTSDPVASGTPYNFEVYDSLGCGPLVFTGQKTCDCVSDAGDLDLTPLSVCEDETVTVAPPLNAILDPNDAFIFILHADNGTNGNTLGTIIDQNTTGVFGFLAGLMNYNTTYFISYVVGNDTGNGVDLANDCTVIAQGVPVVFHNYPTPDAGQDHSECGLAYILSATPSVGVGQWTLVSGPGTATFEDALLSTTQVDVDQYGVYTFAWTEDNNGCTGGDELQVTFNDDPVLAGTVAEQCNLLDFTFTVSFSITGGQMPYMVTGPYGGTLTGDSFVSDPIPNLTGYAFEVYDANGCGPLLIEGQVECVCFTDAGQMNVAPVQVCADESVIVDPTVGAALDPEDILLYVLHNGSGDMLGSEVYAYNTVPEFSLIAPMQTGVTYYISAIAGNDLDSDGVIDSNDPCVSVAPGTPVMFTALPQASFSGDATVCEGQTANLPLTVISSTGCVDITYQLSDGTSGTLTCVQTGDVLAVLTGTNSLTATILQVTDQNGCAQAGNSVASITVNSTPEATVTATATICNSTDSGYPTVLNFSTLVTAGDQGGIWVNTDGALVTGAFPSLNFNGAIPGQYTFTYTTDSALPPCQEQSYTVEVTVEDCACPVLDFLPAAPLCNEGNALNMSTLQVESNSGIYTVTSGPVGAVNFPQINGAILDASGADPGQYTVTFTLSDTPPQGCPIENSFPVTISNALTSGTAGVPAELCQGVVQSINLNNMLVGADPGGAWAETSASPSTGGAFNAANGTFNTSGQGAKTYRFRYTVTPSAPCPVDFTEVEVIIHPLPIAVAGPDDVLTCDEPVLELGGNSSTGAGITYTWTAAGGAFPGQANVPNPQVSVPGTYTLTVVNTLTGCTASDQVVLTSAQEEPYPSISIKPISCFGENDGAIYLDSVSGGVPPYLISINGGPFSGNTQFLNLPPDTYTLVVEDANGCQTDPAILIDIQQPQELNVTLVAYLEGDNIIRLGEAVDMEALVNIPPGDIDTLMWTPAGILDCDTCLRVSATPLQTMTFSVTIVSNGCSDSDALQIVVRKNKGIYAPTAFSPNGDGENDVFLLFGGKEVAQIQTFLVFDRWGEPVLQQYNIPPNDPIYGWDGTLRGQEVDPAVFTWFAEVEFIDGRVEIYKGDVSLVR